MQVQRTLGHREDGSLLNERGLLEALGLDAAEELVLEVEIMVALDNGVPVGLRIASAAVSSLHGRDADRRVLTSMTPSGSMGLAQADTRGRWEGQDAEICEQVCTMASVAHCTAQQPHHNASQTTQTVHTQKHTHLHTHPDLDDLRDP
jgi:hypothetical protein